VRNFVCFLTVLIAACATTHSAFPPEAEIQRLLDERISAKPGRGVVLATYGPGRATKVFIAGVSGKPGLPLNGDTLFEIGSITKTLTASLLADMVERGELKLTDPVQPYLPGVKLPVRGGRQITFADLATHTSGFPLVPENISPKDMSNPYSDYSVEMLDAFVSGYQLPREIGEKYQYSAVGYGLLGRALGQRLGMSWEDAVRTRIAIPLGMNSTAASLDDALRARLAVGHDENGNVVSNWEFPAMPAMGALHSSVNDMLRFLAANIDPASRPFGKVFAQMHVPRTVMDEETQVGLAWQTGHATNRTMVWHGGGTGGYRTLIAFEPSTRVGVVVLSNWASGADDIGFHLLDRTLPIQGGVNAQ
jgi:serine-type D-Ala-D-Ala carboxypeptidase/endopeptidase